MEEVWFAIEKDADGYPTTRDWEGLRAVKRGRHYEIRSAPFYAKGIAYGDVVKAENSAEGFLKFQEVIQRGGFSIFRLYLRKLIAMAVPPSVNLEKMTRHLLPEAEVSKRNEIGMPVARGGLSKGGRRSM